MQNAIRFPLLLAMCAVAVGFVLVVQFGDWLVSDGRA